MSEAENLHIVAEVGIALAGFSGVVVALGQRSGSPRGFGRLWLLLAQALGAVIFAFVPLLLEAAGLEPSANWRVTNGALSVFGFSILIGISLEQRLLLLYPRRWGWWGSFGVSLTAISSAIYVLLAIYAFGGFPSSGAFLNLLGLVWLLAMASMNFILLLLGEPSRE